MRASEQAAKWTAQATALKHDGYTGSVVARKMIGEHGMPEQAALNLRLGGFYLSGLLKQFKDLKHYAIASYNAGAGSVGRWRKEHPEDSIDEWVEKIPLNETRNYVKRVLRSYNTYRLLYPPPVPVPPKLGMRR